VEAKQGGERRGGEGLPVRKKTERASFKGLEITSKGGGVRGGKRKTKGGDPRNGGARPRTKQKCKSTKLQGKIQWGGGGWGSKDDGKVRGYQKPKNWGVRFPWIIGSFWARAQLPTERDGEGRKKTET